MLKTIERIEKVMFQSGNFKILSVVTLGRKSAVGKRLDPFYSNNYASRKYNDRPELINLTLNNNEYLVFSYNEYIQESQTRINEEIFMSYPHMESLMQFLQDMYTLATDPNTFTESGVSVEASELVVESEPFISGKRMIAFPAVWESKQDANQLRRGMILALNDDNILVQLETNAIYSIIYQLSNFNLSLESNQLIIMAMLNEMASTGVVSTQSNTNTSSGIQTTPRGLFGNSGSGTKKGGLGTRTTGSKFGKGTTIGSTIKRNQTETQEEPEQNESAPETRSASSGKGILSMDSIMNEADKIDVDDIDTVEI